MILTVLGSSSKGNCYILGNENEAIILEAGIHPKEIKKALNFDISKIKGCLSSHLHGDHSKHLRDINALGIPVYANTETLLHHKLGVMTVNRHYITHKKQFKIGNFKIMPFSLNHDVPNLGFYINHPDTGNIVFATDTDAITYKFDKVSTYIIEANYSMDLLNKNIENGSLPYFVAKRSLNSHMDINTTVEYLKKSDLLEVRNIVLIHLSGGNSNSEQFKKEIEQITGKNTYIASKGLKISLTKEVF